MQTFLEALFTTWRGQRGQEPCLGQPDALASFDQFTRDWRRTAAALAAGGITRGDRVAYVGRNRPEEIELFVAGVSLGAVFAPLNVRLGPSELHHVLTVAEPTVVVTTPEFLDAVRAASGSLLAAPTVVVIGADDPARVSDPAVRSWRRWREAATGTPAVITVADEDPALLMFTSGTTGAARGVVHSHGSLTAMVANRAHYELSPSTVALIGIPMFHALGLAFALQTLAAGGRVVVQERTGPREIAEVVEHHGVTAMPAVPALLRSVLDDLDGQDDALASLELIVYSGSPISPDLFRHLTRLDCDVMQVYGLTETMGATALSPDDHRAGPSTGLLASCGRPLDHVRIRIVDPENGEDVADGIHGEVWVSSPTTCSGYRGDPAATSATLTPDGWVRSGDGGTVRDGYLYLGDRIKDLIISGGENISPAEVEAVLATHPAVAEVAVVGAPSDRWGETVRAVVVAADPGDPPSPQDLIGYARARLAAYKCPTIVEFLEALPRNATGKILRTVLRGPQPVAAGTARTQEQAWTSQT